MLTALPRQSGKSRERWLMTVATVAEGGTVSMFTLDKAAARRGIAAEAERLGVAVKFEDVDSSCMRIGPAK